MEDKLSKQEENLLKILNHKNNVLNNCLELARKIVKTNCLGDDSERFARQLIQRGYAHDNSKLDGIEWEYLHKGEEFLELAHSHHTKTNDHHPEFWVGGVQAMPEICIAEWVCDIKARSTEFGTDVREWLTTTGAKRFGYSLQGKFYKSAKKFLDLLLEEPFS